MYDVPILKQSHAGLRFIAQMTLYNRGDLDRLRAYIADSYTAAALDEQPVDARLDDLNAIRAEIGRLKVHQVIAYDPHHVVILMEPEKGDAYFINDLEVEEEYPHRIIGFAHYEVEVE